VGIDARHLLLRNFPRTEKKKSRYGKGLMRTLGSRTQLRKKTLVGMVSACERVGKGTGKGHGEATEGGLPILVGGLKTSLAVKKKRKTHKWLLGTPRKNLKKKSSSSPFPGCNPPARGRKSRVLASRRVNRG